MKNISFYFFLLLVNPIHSQKFDNNWLMGYGINFDTFPFFKYNIQFNFDTNPPQIHDYLGNIRFDQGYNIISDSVGRTSLITNDCAIYDKDEQIILGGDSLKTGWEFDEECNIYGMFPFGQSTLFLPAPHEDDKIYLFHVSTYKSTQLPLIIYTQKIQYTTVNMKLNNGKGAVEKKRQVLLNGEFGYGQVTAVKHGNGRDWWLPTPVNTGNKIHLSLLTKDTVFVHHAQEMGPKWSNSGAFFARFSSDGSKYVRFNPFYGVYLYNFDRCSGELSNLTHFNFIDSVESLTCGAEFSPNGRWLYLCDYKHIWQLDTEAADVLSSKTLVADWFYDSSFSQPLHDWFYSMQLCPDGKIYVSPPNGLNMVHIIQRPDLRGTDCKFEQHAIFFNYYYDNRPNFPNYRLGALDGSPCDTVGFDNRPLADFRPDPSDTAGLAFKFWDLSSYQPTNWVWDFGDGSFNTEPSPNHVFAAPGFYTVCVTVSNQYGSDSKCKVIEVFTTGTLTPGKFENLKLYPNPTTGVVHFWDDDFSQKNISIFDVSGKVVYQNSIYDNKIDLSHLANGFYLVKKEDSKNGRVQFGKLFLEK